ncbi:MAG TPA: undecaprenyl-diphosphate phosphatase [Longimicrobiaceae bacterium]|nr:undecaprenyl-diphosphate phosphatase [Longimicrobiaceae bacterium]
MDILVIMKAVILGLVEGATEFIPVSSTGHLILVRDWLNWTNERADVFIIFIQLPAILAVVWLYREKVVRVLGTLKERPESRRLVLNLVIGTLPAVIIGLPTDDFVERYLYNPMSVAIALVLGGIAILLIERANHKVKVQYVDNIPLRLAFWVGVVQVLAVLFPGVSRSGATIMGGIALGLSRVAATEFSFFLAIPAMIGATGLKLFEARDLLTVGDIPVFAVGAIVSFVSALVVIKALLAFVSNHTFVGFAWYRIVLGVILVVFYWGAWSPA